MAPPSIPSEVWTKRMANMVRMIVHAAREGQRCPNVNFFRRTGLVGDPLVCQKKLIEEGVLRVEVWPGYYRVAEIIKGKYAGMRTKEYEGPQLYPVKILDIREPNGGQTLKKQR